MTEVLEVVDAAPDVQGKQGRPRRRPKELYADRAYDSERHRRALRDRGIKPRVAKRKVPHGSGLGAVRWVVERFLGWLHRFGKLQVRTDRQLETHDALLKLACSIICLNVLLNPQTG